MAGHRAFDPDATELAALLQRFAPVATKTDRLAGGRRWNWQARYAKHSVSMMSAAKQYAMGLMPMGQQPRDTRIKRANDSQAPSPRRCAFVRRGVANDAPRTTTLEEPAGTSGSAPWCSSTDAKTIPSNFAALDRLPRAWWFRVMERGKRCLQREEYPIAAAQPTEMTTDQKSRDAAAPQEFLRAAHFGKPG